MNLAMLAVVALVGGAAASVFWPLRASGAAVAPRGGLEALEVARDAKLLEINDLELDFRLGKLSESDYEALKATLRAEAVAIIRELDGARSAS
jgi:hypothetical protein